MGADDGAILSDQGFEGSDSFGIAHILTKAIQKVGGYDLILCGRQAADWDEGLVGSIIAENLSLPLVTLAVAIDVIEKELKVKRVLLMAISCFLCLCLQSSRSARRLVDRVYPQVVESYWRQENNSRLECKGDRY